VKQSAGCVVHENDRCSSQETESPDRCRTSCKAATRCPIPQFHLIATSNSPGRRDKDLSGREVKLNQVHPSRSGLQISRLEPVAGGGVEVLRKRNNVGRSARSMPLLSADHPSSQPHSSVTSVLEERETFLKISPRNFIQNFGR